MFKYSNGQTIQIGDRVAVDQLDGRGIINSGYVQRIISPSSNESIDYSCESTGGILIEFDDGDLQLWLESDSHLVQVTV